MKIKTLLALVVSAILLASCTANPASLPAAENPTSPPAADVPTSRPEPTALPTPTDLPAPTPGPEPAPLMLTDDRGRTLELSGPARAIVTLGPSALEGLFAIGAGGQVIGREEYSTFPEEALAIANIGSMFGELPAEAILALEPDLVIAPEIISREQVQALEDLGLIVYWQANPKDFPGLFSNLMALAELSGRQAEAEALVAELEARVVQVEDALAAAESRPTVFYELDATDPDNPYTTGAGTFIDTIITMAGGENIGAVLEGEYAQISAEEVILQDPEIIILGDAPYGVTAETVAARAGWASLQAVTEGRIYPFDPFLVSVPGPRLVDGLEMMARLLHPEIFD